jgi:Zn finger protein HypA/HybF involved in hydrogenase expression
MGVFTTLAELCRASTQNPTRGEDLTRESDGAYWCHDCDERVLDIDAEGDAAPDCPSCGDEMSFERSAVSTGCAC